MFLLLINIEYIVFFFFFQAEDGIRDGTVTGVQTCALPISTNDTPARHHRQPAQTASPTAAAPNRAAAPPPAAARQPAQSPAAAAQRAPARKAPLHGSSQQSHRQHTPQPLQKRQTPAQTPG